MSGTSLDGIDAALVQLAPKGNGYDLEIERFSTVPFEDRLRRRLEALLPPHIGAVAAAAQLHADLGAAFAQIGCEIAADSRLDYVATHGLTIYHDGPGAVTLQIGRPYDLRDALHATVTWDFRSADCALGGQGAPLVPFVDAMLLGSGDENRVAVNIGGICNVTILPQGGSPQDVLAFDTGPGTMLLDAFVRERTGDPFDRNGRYTAAGTVEESLAARLLSDSYFALDPPKSTGRERFGRQVLDACSDVLAHLTLEDGCATLAAVTIRPLASAIRRYGGVRPRVIAGGGGARNPALMRMLEVEVGQGTRVECVDRFGIDSDAKEAVAFAILGYETLRGRPANLPRVTGAGGQTVLGSIVPYELPALLAAIGREVVAADR